MLIETLVLDRWRSGHDVSLEQLATLVLAPPIREIGMFTLDQVISPKRREQLSGAITGVLESRGFRKRDAEGRIAIEDLLATADGSAAATVITFSDHGPNLRRLLVAILIAKLQGIDCSTRPVVCFDEAAEFIPRDERSWASRPVHALMLTAASTGINVVMVTQALSDLSPDVEDLCETWFVGKMPVLPSRREVVEGLDLVDPPIDEVALERRLASLQAGEFVLRSTRLRTLGEFRTASAS